MTNKKIIKGKKIKKFLHYQTKKFLFFILHLNFFFQYIKNNS